MQKTFSIVSLGCPRNLVDSEKIASEFRNKGFLFQDEVLGAHTVIINTCAFIEDAKKESIDVILKAIDAKKEGHVKKIIVGGCLPERYKSTLTKELKEVDEFRGVLDFSSDLKKDSPFRLTPKHTAYIKISEGCRNACSYCIIPRLKGPYKSRGVESIEKEAGSLIRDGVKEIVLVGQDTSLYGIDLYKNKELPRLLKILESIAKDKWVRILYMHPRNLDREVIKVIKDSSSVCKYIDLPIEHINDRILKQMNRKITKAQIYSLIEYIRANIPDAAIRTSIIVGFPGETEKEFSELYDFIKEIKFERLGVFRYSREEGTPAYRYKNQVHEREKDARFNELMKLQEGVSREVNERFKGGVLKVLVEEKEEDYFVGRTEYDAPDVDGVVYVRGKGLKIGNFYNVRITDTYEYDLVGVTSPTTSTSEVDKLVHLRGGSGGTGQVKS